MKNTILSDPSGIRELTESEMSQVAGGQELPQVDVYADREPGMRPMQWQIPAIVSGSAAFLYGEAKQAVAERAAAEQRVAEQFIRPDNVGPVTEVFWNGTAGSTRPGSMLKDSGFVAIDRDRNGKFDLIISPPWTNVSGQVMSNGGNGWGMGWFPK